MKYTGKGGHSNVVTQLVEQREGGFPPFGVGLVSTSRFRN